LFYLIRIIKKYGQSGFVSADHSIIGQPPRVAPITLLLLLFGVTLSSFAQNLPESSAETLDWLDKIAAAPRQYSYVGTFVYYADEHMETSRIVHVVDAQGEREKIEVLDGVARVIIRNNDEMRFYLPESKTVVIERRWFRKFFPDILQQPPKNLNGNYYIKKGKQERVSGYDCQIIILKPRDKLRYGHKLWVDIETGLVLKVAAIDANRIIEQFAFAQLIMGDKASDVVDFDSELSKQNYFGAATQWRTYNLMASILKNGELGWQVKDMPPGFKKIIEMKRNLVGKSMEIDHVALSDGFATVSVFIEPILTDNTSSKPEFYSGRGATNIYVRTKADHKITTVGEVPLETLRKIGSSVFKH
jgi:sigma-E factor negative regulatory protein RseB